MKISTKKLLKKVIEDAQTCFDEVDFAEKMYNLWVDFDVTDEQTNVLERAKNCGPARVANTNGECLI